MATSTKKQSAGDFTGSMLNVGIFMSSAQETTDRREKCIFYGSLPQETGGLTPMICREYNKNLQNLMYVNGLSNFSKHENKKY